MIRTDNLETVMKNQREVVDYFVNDKCIECGSCCGRYLPLSGKEINQIKAYIKRHNIKQNLHSANVMRNPVMDVTCPFLDDTKENNKCNIYDVRPQICREFTCRKFVNGYRGSPEMYKEKRIAVDMTETFFPSMPKEYKEFIGRVKEYKEQVEP